MLIKAHAVCPSVPSVLLYLLSHYSMWQAGTVKPGSTKVEITQSTDLNKMQSKYWLQLRSEPFNFHVHCKTATFVFPESPPFPESVTPVHHKKDILFSCFYSRNVLDVILNMVQYSTSSQMPINNVQLRLTSAWGETTIILLSVRDSSPAEEREITSENKNRSECWNGVEWVILQWDVIESEAMYPSALFCEASPVHKSTFEQGSTV